MTIHQPFEIMKISEQSEGWQTKIKCTR